MDGLEFYIYENELWYRTLDGRMNVLTEDSSDIIGPVIDAIRVQYPEAYEALSQKYRSSCFNVPYFQYLIVRRFCKCNFGKLDTTRADFFRGTFSLERVECPLRGECELEGIVCNPKFNSSISSAEMRVMKLWYEGCQEREIAHKLYLSQSTVKNHIRSVYRKLNIQDKAEFIHYAKDNNLFGDK